MKYRWQVEGTKNGDKAIFQGITETNDNDWYLVRIQVISDIDAFFNRLCKTVDVYVSVDYKTVKFQREGE